MPEIKKTVIIPLAVGLAALGGILGYYLLPEQIQEIKITETQIEIPKEYYDIMIVGIADKYDLSQSDLKGKKISSSEYWMLLQALNLNAQELKGHQFTDFNTGIYEKSLIRKALNYLRNDTEIKK